jgi:hypothetical protein
MRTWVSLKADRVEDEQRVLCVVLDVEREVGGGKETACYLLRLLSGQRAKCMECALDSGRNRGFGAG